MKHFILIVLLCVLVIVPASAQQDREPSFWLKRIYEQVDGIAVKVEGLKESQADLRQALSESRLTQDQKIEELAAKVDRMDSAMDNADIQRRTRMERIWDWVIRIAAPLIVLLIGWGAKNAWHSIRNPRRSVRDENREATR